MDGQQIKSLAELRNCVPLSSIEDAKKSPKILALARILSYDENKIDGQLLGMLILAFAIGYTECVKQYGEVKQ